MNRDVFNAIADPTRRNILLSLMAKEQNVNAIANQFEMTRQAVSLHVKYLQECGVISIKKEGRERICNLEASRLSEIADWLEPFKKLWEKRFDQLDQVLDELQAKRDKK